MATWIGTRRKELARCRRALDSLARLVEAGGPSEAQYLEATEAFDAIGAICATDLSACSQADLNRTALQLNQRPRKTLAFRSPSEVLDEIVVLTS